MCVPSEIQPFSTIGPRAGVTVTTTSAPRTTSSRLVEARIAKRSYLGCCSRTKLSRVCGERRAVGTGEMLRRDGGRGAGAHDGVVAPVADGEGEAGLGVGVDQDREHRGQVEL